MLEKIFGAAPTPEQMQQQKEAEKQQALDADLAQEQAALDAAQDPGALTQLALRSHFTKIRQAAAEKIHDLPALQELEKHSHDKAVQHLVREKLKQHKHAQAEQQQAAQQIEDLCAKLEQLAKSSHSPLFKQQCDHLLREWQQLDAAIHREHKAALLTRFELAKQRCEAILVEFAAEETRLQQQRDAESALLAEQEKQKEIWAKLAEEQKVEQEQLALKKQAEEEAQKKHARDQAQLVQGIDGILPAVELLLQDGQINQATKKLKNAQSKLEQLDKQHAHDYEGKLQLLNKRLAELRDWQGFAAIPKKQELIASMQKLIGAELPAQDLQKAIHDLQEQWKNLKGGGLAEEQALWTQFKEASDKAYEPCKLHFDNQKQQRSENLKQRELICEQLETYEKSYQWEQADWKAVDKIIETAKKDFWRFSPVDHKHVAPIKERFEGVLKPIVDKLRAVQQQNEQQKQQLVEQALKLADLADIPAAIEAAKKLQAQWKTIGITRPREDQKLWQQFRSACDAVFKRRDAEKQQQADNRQQDIVKAEDICKQIQALAALEDSELQKSRDAYQDLRKQFQGITSLSKEKNAKVFRNFYATCDHYQERVDGIKGRKQQSALQEAFRKADLCAQLESGSLSLDEAQAQWASLTAAISIEHSAALDKRYAQAQKIARGEHKADFAANDKARRIILIRLEMLKNKETPAEDKALRMDFSLKQLSGNFGKKIADPKQEQQTLTLEWLSAPVGLPENRDTLQERFNGLVK